MVNSQDNTSPVKKENAFNNEEDEKIILTKDRRMVRTEGNNWFIGRSYSNIEYPVSSRE